MKNFIFFLLASAVLLLNAQKTAMPASTLRLGYGFGIINNSESLGANISNQLQMEYAFAFTKHWAVKTGTYIGKSHFDFNLDCPVGEPFSRYTGNSYNVSIPLIINTFYHVKPHHKWHYFTGIGLLYNYNYRTSFSNYDWEGQVYSEKRNFSLKEGQKICYGIEIGLRRYFLGSYFADLSLNRFLSFNDKNNFFSQNQLNFCIGKTLNAGHKKQ